MRWLCIGFATWAVAACSDDGRSPPIPQTNNGGTVNVLGGRGGSTGAGTGGKADNGGTTGKGGGGGDAGSSEAGEGGVGGADTNALAPIVEIVSPLEVLDPNGSAIITLGDAATENVKVVCKATASEAPGATAVDTSTIMITALNAAGVQLDQERGQPLGNSQYETTLQLTNAANGAITFMCTASDKSRPPVTGKATIGTFVDRGPAITVVDPPEKAASRPLASPTHFEFSVAASPLWDAPDPGADVAMATLMTGTVPIATLAADPKRPGTYVAEVDFTDTKLFPETPAGTMPVTITATNKRKPKAATRTKQYTFELDGAGPTVAITSPVEQAMISGLVQTKLTFTATDSGSGVDPSSVLVQLNNATTYRYNADDPSWTIGVNDKTYTFSFLIDRSKFTGSVAQVNVSVEATDKAGNVGQRASRLLHVDDFSPIVSLDPPNARIVSYGSTPADAYCSAPFDPLGDSPKDGSKVQLNALIRTFIWERTNGTISSQVLYHAGVKTSSPRLYMQRDTSKPILIDTNGDGTCDDIAPEVKATHYWQLSPIPARGVGNTNMETWSAAPAMASNFCKTQSIELRNICSGFSEMQFVLGQRVFVGEMAQNTPAVWSVGVGTENSQECAGSALELGAAGAAEGWLCFAAEATDNVGNKGVSPPLRLCLDSELAPGAPACASDLNTRPSCTLNCTPPPVNINGFGNDAAFVEHYK
ncbi:MAG: hypothetical protein ACOY0T_41020 [Myxococcota bacterium]